MALKIPYIQPFDSDAQRFILAAGLTRYEDKRAINYLVQGLKTYNLWSKMAAVYPMVGGNLWSCKFNLVNPIDSNAAFRLTFVASPTISYSGVDWNGSTQYANTNLVPSTTSPISLNSSHVSYYSRDNIAENSIDMGVTDGSNKQTVLDIRIADNTMHCNNNSLGTDTALILSNTDSRGFFIDSRVNSTQIIFSMNGTITTNSTFNSSTVPNLAMYIGCRNGNGTPQTFASKQCAFASIGSGLTTTDAANFHSVVKQFQIILNRAAI